MGRDLFPLYSVIPHSRLLGTMGGGGSVTWCHAELTSELSIAGSCPFVSLNSGF